MSAPGRQDGDTAPRRPSAVLFDAGGTLVLQDPERMGLRLGMMIDPALAYEAHYRTMAEFSSGRLSGVELTWDWWLERYFGRLGHPAPDRAGFVIERGFGLWNLAVEGGPEAVTRLTAAGIRTGVVSNSDGSVEKSLVAAGYAGLFEFVIDSQLVAVSKPDPRIFHMAVDLMGVDRDRVWYVGDSVFHDIGGAQAAGLAGAVLIDPYGLHPEVPLRIRSITALPDLLGISDRG